MATAIASLPNEVPQNNVVMKVNETNNRYQKLIGFTNALSKELF